jgi:hypothetical protein
VGGSRSGHNFIDSVPGPGHGAWQVYNKPPGKFSQLGVPWDGDMCAVLEWECAWGDICTELWTNTGVRVGVSVWTCSHRGHSQCKGPGVTMGVARPGQSQGQGDRTLTVWGGGCSGNEVSKDGRADSFWITGWNWGLYVHSLDHMAPGLQAAGLCHSKSTSGCICSPCP